MVPGINGAMISSQDSAILKQKCELAMVFAAGQLQRLVHNHPDTFPMYTEKGKWIHGGEAWTNWCEGFLGGQLWLVHLFNREPWFRVQAERYSRLIENRKMDRSVHDLGFLFWPTWKRWYDLSGDPEINKVVVQAGKTLATRFQEKGAYLRSFVAVESLFIDIMMNVGVIFYAAQEAQDEELWGIAMRHCLTTRRFLVRGDGSTAHEGIFDPKSGVFLRQSTHQGWRSDSSWARGQAWALYGFGTAYAFTQDVRFLKTALVCADYYIDQTPDHGVPPNDWLEPEPQYSYESSAAAIAASGLLNLAQWVQEDTARQYRDYAAQIIRTLTTPDFLAVDTPGWEGVLKHGIYHLKKGLGVDESVMWGDYFFLEAVEKFLAGEN